MVRWSSSYLSVFLALLVMLVLQTAAIGRPRLGSKRPARPLVMNEISESAPDNLVLAKMPAIVNSDKYFNIKSTKRRLKANVNPISDCKSQTFKEELNLLRSKVKCKPRLVVVHLESTTTSTLMPNSVLVKRCDGMCSSTHKCIANVTRDQIFYVREIKNNLVSCSSVIVSEDVSCTCDCPQRATDCKVNQDYDKDRCRCICKNEKDYEKCHDKRKKRNMYYWDDKECSCFCLKEKVCTTGTVWNRKHCRCISESQP
ncbi:PREDICTED: balbiani ring protein 3-like isoform X2 [Nicrophorus vespilloides]|uniref:Balbiani ring protein 3-like isoform X2 n=1 Tax=Nicrophorus vespilloides TaxID=110193 RepID=A0ABM1M7G0_NICVS|nr:PREDICTED: balbiani ring protein 3-like isoform X2 [Nicrophorus vespilloides]